MFNTCSINSWGVNDITFYNLEGLGHTIVFLFFVHYAHVKVAAWLEW